MPFFKSLHQNAENRDFNLPDVVLTLNSEITAASLNITIINDNIPEEMESFALGIEGFSDFDIDVRFPEPALIVIEDDDQIILVLQSQSMCILGTVVSVYFMRCL